MSYRLIDRKDPFKIIKLYLIGFGLLAGYWFLKSSDWFIMKINSAVSLQMEGTELKLTVGYLCLIAITLYGGLSILITTTAALIIKGIKKRKEEKEFELY